MAKTKGATSTVRVSLRDLMDKLDTDMNVPVSRSFAKEVGLLDQEGQQEEREGPKTKGTLPDFEEI